MKENIIIKAFASLRFASIPMPWLPHITVQYTKRSLCCFWTCLLQRPVLLPWGVYTTGAWVVFDLFFEGELFISAPPLWNQFLWQASRLSYHPSYSIYRLEVDVPLLGDTSTARLVPIAFRKAVIRSIHDIHHPGIKATIRLVSASRWLTATWLARKGSSTSMSTCTLSTGWPHAWRNCLEPMKWSWRHSSSCCIKTSRMAGHTHTHLQHGTRAQQPPVSRKSTRSVPAKAVGPAWWERPTEVWRLSPFPAGCPTPLFQPASQLMRSGGPEEETWGMVREKKSVLSAWSHCSSQHHYQQQQQPHCYVVFILVIYLFLIPSHYRKETLTGNGCVWLKWMSLAPLHVIICCHVTSILHYVNIRKK